ncbi:MULTISPECIES: ring-cleaving dioxygenase [unclassified Paenibacillus]|uniref:ring-cleaving dioxygenase n=1 Tax=unclassified Paenibacillus TaxID=185978 RepID=UPI001AE18BC4|nr:MULTISPECIES: ring-cleaving dioxygenase [unclassified Paenibacillus]MBP1155553.1 glyoxalase family protein [Paenibacillus sp. PvP091]MBP1169061.1 glyoxalase family protein [Paenibacillus sp. PvR098]MBP2440089.1 glyoxalase family protein [Paenibacillus sp. PvP052]
MNVKGIHHLSAMTGNAPGNFKFYTEVLGMRLVKKTVNQDDTTAYHLFYGDERGNPGTELTFFDFPGVGPTSPGISSISGTSLRVPSDAALRYWIERFTEHGVKHSAITEFADRNVIFFEDPEGQKLALVSDETNVGVIGGIPWDKSPVPAEFGIIGLGPVKLTVRKPDSTLAALRLIGFTEKKRIPALVEGQDDIIIMQTGEGGSGAEVQVEPRSDLPVGRQGKGGVHHVAFRVEDKQELLSWIEILNKAGLPNSGFVERYYFRSLYFREPNGILFELATDGPGFATDEPYESLGESLALPPFLENQRKSIEENLKPLETKR